MGVLATPPRQATALPFDPASASDEAVLAHARAALQGGHPEQTLACAAVVAGRSENAEHRCEAFWLQSNAYRLHGSWNEAIAAARFEARVAEGASLADRLAEALDAEAAVLLARGELDAALPLLQRALRAATSPRLLGVLWQNVGTLEARRGNHHEAEDALDTSRRFFEDSGDLWGSACCLIDQGCVRLDHADYEGATTLLARAIAVAHATDDASLLAGAMGSRAHADMGPSRLDDAKSHAGGAAGLLAASRMLLRHAQRLLHSARRFPS